jgi:tetratricopeptide (TPR) repeat protein
VKLFFSRRLSAARRLGLAALLSFGAAMPAAAQTTDSVTLCRNEAGAFSLDFVFEACNALIESGDADTGTLALAYLKRADIYATEGDHKAAISDYSQAIEAEPRSDTAYYNRAVTYADMGEVDLALADFTKAIEINPEHDAAYNSRAAIFANRGDLDLAIAEFTTAIELNPRDPVSVYRRGAAYV